MCEIGADISQRTSGAQDVMAQSFEDNHGNVSTYGRPAGLRYASQLWGDSTSGTEDISKKELGNEEIIVPRRFPAEYLR